MHGGVWTDWPDIGSANYLLQGALQMRLGVSGPQGGLFPQKWSDIVAFCKNVCHFNEPFEFEILFRMSEAYCSELDKGKEPLRKSPIRRDQEKNVKH